MTGAREIKLSLPEARRLAISAQGLAEGSMLGRGREGALRAIEHLGYVQIDTISVVERAHHHVLWSRVPDYSPEQLHQLAAERRVFEYWSHACAWLPMSAFRFSLPLMREHADGTFHWFKNSSKLR